MLSYAEARAVAALLPDHRVVTLADGRGGSVDWYEVFVRGWAAEGVVIRGPDQAAPPVSKAVTVLLDKGRTAGPPPMWIEDLALGGNFLLLESDGDGRLSRDARPVSPRPAPARALELRLSGREPLVLQEVRLPVRLSARVPTNRSMCRFKLEGIHPTETLPPPAWFNLKAPHEQPAELTVDLSPGLSSDKWDVSVKNGEAIPILPPREVETPPVILLFDRTCPDRDRWSAARDIVKVGRSGGRSPDSYKVESGPTDTNAALREINAAIRRGLAKGFAAASSTAFPVEVIWFADAKDNGLSAPPGVELIERACERLDAPVDSTDLPAALEALTYSPGLDLWDALDEALEKAADLAKKMDRAVVLIVGNSPPHLPVEPEGPFWPIINWQGGKTSYRRKSNFLSNLERLKERGVPTACLFLKGHQAAESGSDFHNFQAIQALVRAGFREYLPNNVFDANADEPSVASAVTKTILRLSATVSGLIFAEGK